MRQVHMKYELRWQNVYKLLVGESEWRRSLGIYFEDVRMLLKLILNEFEGMDWIQLG
jgi:hypothetical protein